MMQAETESFERAHISAGYVRRLQAAVLDFFVLLAVDYVVVQVVFSISNLHFLQLFLRVGAWLAVIAGFHSSPLRAMPGQWIYQMQLLGRQGQGLSFKQAYGRAALAVLGLMAFGAGYVMALIHPGRRAFHDWASGSRVVLGRATDK